MGFYHYIGIAGSVILIIFFLFFCLAKPKQIKEVIKVNVEREPIKVHPSIVIDPKYGFAGPPKEKKPEPTNLRY